MCMLCLHNDIFTDITGNDWLKFSTIYTFPKNEILGKPLVGISVMDKAVDYRILSSFTDGELAYVTCFDLDRRTCSNSASGTVLHDVNKDCWCLPDLIVLASVDVYHFTCIRDLFQYATGGVLRGAEGQELIVVRAADWEEAGHFGSGC